MKTILEIRLEEDGKERGILWKEYDYDLGGENDRIWIESDRVEWLGIKIEVIGREIVVDEDGILYRRIVGIIGCSLEEEERQEIELERLGFKLSHIVLK